MSNGFHKLVVLVDGHCDPITAKTAVCLLRYRPERVVAVLDREHAGRTAQDALGCGGAIPVVAGLDEVADSDALAIGIAPPGGRVPDAWRPLLLAAIDRGMGVVSGLHQFLADDPELAAAARSRGATLWDVRRNNERDVASGEGIRADRLRVLTVGHDCSVGKMVTAVEVARRLNERGTSAKFVASGQTGIMVEGDGSPIDCVVSDFVSGAVEKLILANQDAHEVLVVEGQATISHPRYSAVSTGLLHGSRPQGLIMVYEPIRTHVHGMPGVPLHTLPRLIQAYEDLASLVSPTKVIALAVNGRRMDPEAARQEVERIEGELGLPAADPVRDGPDKLCDAILARRDELLRLASA